jgi:hypothetical protein
MMKQEDADEPVRITEGGEKRVADHLDVPLEDAVLLEEVQLISSLMIAATETDDDLDQNEIDRLLGLHGGTIPEQQHHGPS